jgi:hypothetical protein
LVLKKGEGLDLKVEMKAREIVYEAIDWYYTLLWSGAMQ